MSDNLPTEISVDAQASIAGRVRAAVDLDDPITQLREQCKRFIEGANLTSHARMMALPKLDEMIFWIRSGSNRG
jgi:hypothetical protein